MSAITGTDMLILGGVSAAVQWILKMITPKLSFIPENIRSYLITSSSYGFVDAIHVFIAAALSSAAAEALGLLSISPGARVAGFI